MAIGSGFITRNPQIHKPTNQLAVSMSFPGFLWPCRPSQKLWLVYCVRHVSITCRARVHVRVDTGAGGQHVVFVLSSCGQW